MENFNTQAHTARPCKVLAGTQSIANVFKETGRGPVSGLFSCLGRITASIPRLWTVHEKKNIPYFLNLPLSVAIKVPGSPLCSTIQVRVFSLVDTYIFDNVV